MSRAQATTTVLADFDTMDEDKRAVFALVELDRLTVPEVAKLLDLNLTTTYSRLRSARHHFEARVRAAFAAREELRAEVRSRTVHASEYRECRAMQPR